MKKSLGSSPVAVTYICTHYTKLKDRLREKCPNTDFFLVQIQENTDQKNSVFGNFSRSAMYQDISVVSD